MANELLEKMFEWSRWNDLIEHGLEKGIDLKMLKALCVPQTRVRLYDAILNGTYEIMPPHQIEIPKDDGTMRIVYANEEQDRVLCTLVNDVIMELFSDLIHHSCVSYQKHKGCQETIQKISREVVKRNMNGNNVVGYISDFSKFFDTVSIEAIDNIFDEWERRLGFNKDEEPVINMMRKYYHNDLYFDLDGKLQKKYLSLRQGCALAAALSCMVLYELDDFMTKKYDLYYRYSDDILCLNNNVTEIVDDINRICNKYNVQLNPKKVRPVYSDVWFKFLGFNIKGDMITLSKNRVKRFQKEIEARTIKKRNITFDNARRSIIKYLYDGDRSWASSCLGTVNCKADLDQMNLFIMDCLRAVQTGKRKIGGLGSVNNLPDRTILRGTGKNVTSNRNKTEKQITNYLSMGCLSNAMKLSKDIYGACVRSM